MAIGTDVGSAFGAGSGLDAADIQIVVAGLATAGVLLFSAWYLMKVFARGWRKGDLPHVLTGTMLVLLLMFFVFWIAGQDW
ncbi:MAG: hypothetical protein F4X92_05060 [Gammaproteobacteria bacterium]|nr:hypothetical protein [Gammaproteobacteria bacterium]